MEVNMRKRNPWNQYGFCEYAGEKCEISLIRIESEAVGGGIFYTYDNVNCSFQSSDCPQWRKCPLVIAAIAEWENR